MTRTHVYPTRAKAREGREDLAARGYVFWGSGAIKRAASGCWYFQTEGTVTLADTESNGGQIPDDSYSEMVAYRIANPVALCGESREGEVRTAAEVCKLCGYDKLTPHGCSISNFLEDALNTVRIIREGGGRAEGPIRLPGIHSPDMSPDGSGDGWLVRSLPGEGE